MSHRQTHSPGRRTIRTKAARKKETLSSPPRNRLAQLHRLHGNAVVNAGLQTEAQSTSGQSRPPVLREHVGFKSEHPLACQEEENPRAALATQDEVIQAQALPPGEGEILQTRSMPVGAEVGQQKAATAFRREDETLPGVTLQKTGVQAKLTMSAPGDPYEREADRVARQVVAGLGKSTGVETAQKEPAEEIQMSHARVSRRAEKSGARVDDATEADIARARSGGAPLGTGLRQPMERGFGVDFSAVRLHTDAHADRLNRRLHARAFTLGNEIFFRSGQYRPGTAAGKELLAHELTHVVQQTAPRAVAAKRVPTSAVRNHPRPIISRTPGPPLVQGGWFDWIKKKARQSAAWARKKAQQARAWVRKKIQEAKNFVLNHIENLPGFIFVMSLMGKNPVTNRKAVGGAGNALKSTLSFLGMQEMFINLREAKVFDKAWALFKSSFEEAGLTGAYLARSFQNIAVGLSVKPSSWAKAVRKISAFLASLAVKAARVGRRVVTRLPVLILEGFLVLIGAPVRKMMAIFQKSGEVLSLIAGDPLKFAGHLMKAVRQGFTLFKDNIGSHLKTGLFMWLFGTLAAEGGLSMPAKFDLKGIFSLVTQILGLSYRAIRALLVGILGEKLVVRLEKTWDFLKILMTEGLAGLWQWLKEKMGGLKNRLLDAARGWVVSKLVTAGISKLLSLATGALGLVLEGVKFVYNIVMVFIEKANLFSALIGRIFNSVSAIAHGKVDSAAKFIEKALGFSIPVALSFLASFLNLGNIGAGIKKVVNDLREWFLGWLKKGAQFVARKAKKWLGIGKRKNKAVPVIDDVKTALKNKIKKPFKHQTEAKTALNRLYKEYRPRGLKYLRLGKAKDGFGLFHVVASASPEEIVGEVQLGDARIEFDQFTSSMDPIESEFGFGELEFWLTLNASARAKKKDKPPGPDWELGYVQTILDWNVKNTFAKRIEWGRMKNVRDGRPTAPTPWMAEESFFPYRGESKTVSMRDTPTGGADLEHPEGGPLIQARDKCDFGTWLIALKNRDTSKPVYLGHIHWGYEVEYLGFDQAFRKKTTYQRRGKGRGLHKPRLDGPVVDSQKIIQVVAKNE